jgi:hypothetical protein
LFIWSIYNTSSKITISFLFLKEEEEVEVEVEGEGEGEEEEPLVPMSMAIVSSMHDD